MLYNFIRCVIAAESILRFNSTIGEDILSGHMAQDWITRFCTRDHDVEHQPRSGCQSGLENERLCQLLKDKSQQTAHQLAEDLVV